MLFLLFAQTLMVFPAQVNYGVTAAATQLTSSGMALVDGITATGFHTNDVSHFYRKIRIKVLTSYVVGRVEELEYVRKCVTKNFLVLNIID